MNYKTRITQYTTPVTSDEPEIRGLYHNGHCWEYGFLPPGIYPAHAQGPDNKQILGPVRIWYDHNYAECWCSSHQRECRTNDGRGCLIREITKNS
jgi:hypothetical protein